MRYYAVTVMRGDRDIGEFIVTASNPEAAGHKAETFAWHRDCNVVPSYLPSHYVARRVVRCERPTLMAVS